MQPDEFRHHAHALVDWMADYLRDVGTLPVTSAIVSPGRSGGAPPRPPDAGEPFERLFETSARDRCPG